MTKSTIVLITVLVVLAAAYAYYFTDWFRTPTIQILAQIRPSTRNVRTPAPGTAATYPVSFAFDRRLSLTEVKVVPADEAQTNKYAHALWHLISDSNSVPTKALVYGQPLRGMKPKVPRARPEALQPDVKYRLYVSTGKAEGHIDFKTVEVTPPAQ